MGLSIADITNSILTDKKKVHSVSTLAQVQLRTSPSAAHVLSLDGAAVEVIIK